MRFLRNIFGKSKNENISSEPEHAVIVKFNYGKSEMQPLYDLEAKLEKIIEHQKVGEFDGHDIATDLSEGTLYMYGKNAEVLFKSVEEELKRTDFMKNVEAKLRFGPPEDGIKEILITL